MNYKKQAHTKLHHIEIVPADDGSHIVEAHLIHRPPAADGKKGEHMVPPGHEYPNKKVTMTAEDHEEAKEHAGAILEAHQHEKVRRGRSHEEPEEMEGEHEEEFVN